MTEREKPTDPRRLGGDISGPGGPYEQDSVVFDTTNAVLMQHVDVALADNPSDGAQFIALLLEGRINRSPDRARVLYMFGADGAAALVTELIGVASRAGFGPEFMERVQARLDELP